MYIIGQEQFKNHVEYLKESPKPFIIIKGPKHYGKEYLTKYLAKELGLTYIKMKDNKVKTVRELVENSTYQNDCLYHFVDFDDSTVMAKAALLKVAEETPKGVVIVITINTSTLDTLVSRAYNITLESYNDEDVQEYKSKINKDTEVLDSLIDLSIKTPSMLLYYSEIDNIEDILEDVNEVGDKLVNNRMYIEIATKVSNHYKNPYNDSEVDTSVVFLKLLTGYLMKSKHEKVYDWVTVIEDNVRRIRQIPTISRKMILNECLLGLIYS